MPAPRAAAALRALALLSLLVAASFTSAGGAVKPHAWDEEEEALNEGLKLQFGSDSGGEAALRLPPPREAAPLRKLLATDESNREAWRTLGELYQAGEGGVSRNLSLAADAFERAAALGDPAAQEELGFAYASGLGRAADTPTALLYWYFAASANRTAAQMALGYRHLYGRSVPRSCAAAALYYAPAASAALAPPAPPPPGADATALAAAAALASGFVPGAPTVVEKVRLSADYGAKQASRARERDMVAYYRYSADQGNTDAAAAMGQLLSSGGRGVARDFASAAKYLSKAAERGDPDASAQLGLLYAHGQGVRADTREALRLLRSSAERGLAAGQYGLGLVLLAGTGGVTRDVPHALGWLSNAAESGHAEAHTLLGLVHGLGLAGVHPDRKRAFLHLSTAAQQGGQPLAAYTLAMLQLGAVPSKHPSLPGAASQLTLHPEEIVPGGCRSAVPLLKTVAERGEAVRSIEAAHDAFARGDSETALRLYLRCAEMGMEVAQSNAAFLYGQRAAREAGREADLQRALYWLRASAEQGHVASLVSLGDAHFYGRGTKEGKAAAAAAYARAGEMRSAQALYNLGAMHQLGTGLPVDPHLAKRYYDLARESSDEAAVPVAIALASLRAQAAYRELVASMPRTAGGGGVGGGGGGGGGTGGVKPQAAPKASMPADGDALLLAVLCTALALVLGRIAQGRAAAAAAAAVVAEGEEEGEAEERGPE